MDQAVDQVFAKADLRAHDRAFARAAATLVLRRRGGLRRICRKLITRPLDRDAARTNHLIHLGLAQLIFMDVPDHAAVDSAVALAGKPHKGLVNAVLRRAGRERQVLCADIAAAGTDLPPWLRKRWQDRFDAENFQQICEALRNEPPLDLTAKGDARALAEAVSGQLLPTGSVRLVRSVSLDSLPGFAEGDFWVQDAAAAIPAKMLGA